MILSLQNWEIHVKDCFHSCALGADALGWSVGMYSIRQAELKRGERDWECAVTVNRTGCAAAAAAYRGDEMKVSCR